MRKILTAVLLLGLAASATAEACREFTDDQSYLLRLAYSWGTQHDPELYAAIGDTVGYTMAAMLWEESILDRYVVRWNSGDGEHGSYGVMMVQLTTALHIEGRANTYAVREEHGPRIISSLVTDDMKGIDYGYQYLRERIIAIGTLWGGVHSYNGAGWRADRYLKRVQENVRELMRCGI